MRFVLTPLVGVFTDQLSCYPLGRCPHRPINPVSVLTTLGRCLHRTINSFTPTVGVFTER